MNTNLVFRGGLGNQMFQYALLLALRDRGHEVVADISYYNYVKMHNGYELEHVFGIKDELINKRGLHLYKLRLLDKWRPSVFYFGDRFSFNEELLCSPRKYLSGYWQDERYFKSVEDKVRKAFIFRDIDDANKQIASEMQERNSISLHLRRGDYSAFGMAEIGENYYKSAVEEMHSKLNAPYFYVFSDDKDAVKRMMEELGVAYEVISRNTGKDSFKDMYLMSQCKHNIIANSSFSWWGAWLNGNKEKIVIAPKVWDENHLYVRPQAEGWSLI